MEETAISLNNLSFSFGKLKVINGITLEIPKGISFGLLGANGSGKTTLIRLMVGLLKPAAGSIQCLGKPASAKNAKLVGYMPQLPSLYSELTVAQNIDFFAHIYGLNDKKQRKQRVDETIQQIDLSEKRNVQIMKLSGGMKQRVSLGCAIVHQPRLIFLDEPTVGLDPELRVHFWEFFGNLTKSGTTLVISSHTMDDAAHCQRLLFLWQGKVIALGTPDELKASTGKPEATLEDAFLFYIRRGEVKCNVQ
jgi:ABC-2 type transport system ATP-binding protein